MKSLSIKQPFPALIMSGFKTLEIRSWKTKYRGPLLICSGMEWHYKTTISTTQQGTILINNEFAPSRFNLEKFVSLFGRGRAFCTVDLVDIYPFENVPPHYNAACIDWQPDQYAWQLENVRLIEPFPVKGKLSLFETDESLIKYI